MAALLIGLFGCAASTKVPDVVWPDPPDKPRIKYVGSLRSRDDISGPSLRDVLAGKEKEVAVYQPMGLAVSADNKRLYVADTSWNSVFVFDFGDKEFRIIGDRERYPLSMPIGVSLDAAENVYVTDTVAHTVRVYDRNGEFLRDIGKDLLVRPTGIAVDKQRQRLYVVDTGHNDERAHQVKVFDLQGNLLSEIGRRGHGDGEFNFPTFATLDSEGRLYVVDSANFRVQVFDPDGKLLWKLGAAGDMIGDFARPKAVALDRFGNIYVLDSRWSNVQIFNREGKLLLIFGGVGSSPGLLLNPTGIAIDEENRIYVSDTYGRRVSVYQLINTTAEDSWEDGSSEAPKVGKEGGSGPMAKGG